MPNVIGLSTATNSFFLPIKQNITRLCNYGYRHTPHGGWGTVLQAGMSKFRFPMVSLEFFLDIILPAAVWPWGWQNLWQKRVPGISPGGKGGRCVGLTILPSSCADCLEIWKPQTPGPSGPLQASNGTALPLPLPRYSAICNLHKWHHT
jgi:hypothetical protein